MRLSVSKKSLDFKLSREINKKMAKACAVS